MHDPVYRAAHPVFLGDGMSDIFLRYGSFFPKQQGQCFLHVLGLEDVSGDFIAGSRLVAQISKISHDG